MKTFELNQVTCRYKNKPVLENLSFSVEGGESLCLLGPNGVGKTTLFRSMLGFLKPLAGTIMLDRSGHRFVVVAHACAEDRLCAPEPHASVRLSGARRGDHGAPFPHQPGWPRFRA